MHHRPQDLSPSTSRVRFGGDERRSRKTPWLGAVIAAALLVACGGGGSDSATPASTSTGAPFVIPVLAMTTATATVVMPQGVSLGADKVMVLTAIGAIAPAASGAVTVSVYDNGEQLAIVNSPAGNPMMMGWLDATHTTISAATTAQVLAYFALDGALMLSSVERHALISDMPQANGIGALEAAVQAQLAANVDAFAQPNAALKQAVSDFATPYFASARAGGSSASGRARALGVTITPGTQSGIDVLQDPPFAAHVSNTYRRRAHAFVDKVSDTYDTGDVLSAASITDFDVDPVIGVSGGVSGAITDIIGAYYGNKPTAYAPVTAPESGSFDVPLTPSALKTTYRVTIVGAGTFPGSASPLTAPQQQALDSISTKGFVEDFMLPTLANAVLGSGVFDVKTLVGDKAKFAADLTNSVLGDFLAFEPSIPGLHKDITEGHWFTAAVDINNTVDGSSSLRTMIIKGFTDAAVKNGTAAIPDTRDLLGFLNGFNTYLNAAGGLLQVFDSGAYLADIERSDNADQWTLVVNAEKVTLNPAASSIGVGGTVTLEATALGVDDTSGYSYHWTTSTKFGDLNEVAGANRLHQSDYCSSSNQAVFIDETQVADGTVDNVSVQIHSGPNCTTGPKGSLLGTGTATVTYSANAWLGTWAGSVASTCGYYSGPLTYVITSGGDNTLAIAYTASGGLGGGFDATYTGNTATSGDVLTMTLNGDSISLVETDSCQTASFTRQH